jgi:glycosyltransferase involved in cell wall biosynthesis
MMKILYCAIDQVVPGTQGGSVHVEAVAEGLTALGHEVHVLAQRGAGGFPPGAVRWHEMAPPLGSARLRLVRAGRVAALARALRPDVVIERYFNFGGEGMRAAQACGALSVLEVNAPVIDYPGSPKRLLDRVLLVEPMRRWRDWQCRAADVILSPSRAILPAWLPDERVVEIEWGADTDRFRPGATGVVPFERKPGTMTAVFAGAFRAWHGAVHLVDAIRQLRERGVGSISAVLTGDGPEAPRVRRAAAGLDGVTFTGPVAHDAMPALLAAADIGVAPFDVTAHAPLAIAFYWSPLKVFEYMASGLPVVAPSIDGMKRIVEDGREGVLYDPSDPRALAGALERLADGDLRRRLGSAARARAVCEFSWAGHCMRLQDALARALTRRGQRQVRPS